MTKICSKLFALAAAAWFGGIVAIAVFLPMLFRAEALTRTEAADLAGDILLRFDRLALGLLLVLGFCGLVVLVRSGGSWLGRTAVLLLLLAVTASKLGGSFIVRPKMDALRPQITSFEKTAPVTPARDQFQQLHQLAEGLMTLELAALSGLVLAVPGWSRRRDPAHANTSD